MNKNGNNMSFLEKLHQVSCSYEGFLSFIEIPGKSFYADVEMKSGFFLI